MDKFTCISERTVGKEQVDGIHFPRIWERSIRSEKIKKKKKIVQAVTIVCNKCKTCCNEILLIPSAVPTPI